MHHGSYPSQMQVTQQPDRLAFPPLRHSSWLVLLIQLPGREALSERIAQPLPLIFEYARGLDWRLLATDSLAPVLSHRPR
jgi:hypothetical protein